MAKYERIDEENMTEQLLHAKIRAKKELKTKAILVEKKNLQSLTYCRVSKKRIRRIYRR